MFVGFGLEALPRSHLFNPKLTPIEKRRRPGVPNGSDPSHFAIVFGLALHPHQAGPDAHVCSLRVALQDSSSLTRLWEPSLVSVFFLPLGVKQRQQQE